MTSTQPTLGKCDEIGNAIYCDHGPMASGTAASYQVNIQIADRAVFPLGVVVGVLGSWKDPNLQNNVMTFDIAEAPAP